jgi:hypothetical protein
MYHNPPQSGVIVLTSRVCQVHRLTGDCEGANTQQRRCGGADDAAARAPRPREHQRVHRQEEGDVPGACAAAPCALLFAVFRLSRLFRLLFQPSRDASVNLLQVQMSLDTKRAEIRKLEEQAQQREDALKRSESMLEEDAMRFDAFLKENDYKGARS